MGIEENKALVRRWLQSHATGSPDFELLSPDHVNHNVPPGMPQGREGSRVALQMLHNAFSDWHIEIQEMIAEGDRVAVRTIVRLTHSGDFRGTKATGRQITLPAIQIWAIKDGKLADLWEQNDTFSFMQQLGIVPAPEPPRA